MKIKLDEGAKLPTLAHDEDGGFDIYSREEKVVPAFGSAVFDTGVHIALEPEWFWKVSENTVKQTKGGASIVFRDGAPVPVKVVGLLKSKSGLHINHDITSEGVIDMGYTGPIIVKLYNHGVVDYHVHAGDKITQLLITPVFTPYIERVEELEETDRGGNGFGSSGR